MSDKTPLLADYFTEIEAANQLGVTTRTLKRWRDLRQGPPMTRLGWRIFYKRASVAAWLASREQAMA